MTAMAMGFGPIQRDELHGDGTAQEIEEGQ
jgi:hypothetical protein